MEPPQGEVKKRQFLLDLADKIDLSLILDDHPGYYLTKEEQQWIIDCLRQVGGYRQ